MQPFQAAQVGGYGGVSSWWLNVWTTYDTQYFLDIAQRGYQPKSAAFFPLYPLLLRLAGPDENAMAVLGIAISNLAFLGALLLAWKLTTRQLGGEHARRVTCVLSFFPTAVFSMAVYTDALFLLLSLAAFTLARESRWRAAGMVGGLAAMTRNAGPVLSAALLLVAWRSRAAPVVGIRKRDAAWLLLPMIAFVGVQAYFAARFGGLSLLSAQAGFDRAPSLPWMPIVRDLHGLLLRAPALGELRTIVVSSIALLDVLATVAALVFAWRFRRRLAAEQSVVMVGVMCMQLLYARTQFISTASSGRYMLTALAFSQAISLELERRSSRSVRMALSIAGLAVCAWFAFLFGHKTFIA